MDPENLVRCAALVRVSTNKQAQRRNESDETLPVQRQAIRQFLQQYHQDWQLIEEYAEEGVSAYRNTSADRDVLQDVLLAASQRKFDVLLVFKADRLSRQAFEYPVILAQLRRYDIQVISVADAPGGRVLETEGQMDKLLRFIEGWQAETESYNTSVRVLEAMRQMAHQGRWTGGTPAYGFRLAPSKTDPVPLEIHPEEAAVLRRMYDLYLDVNVGTMRIAGQLNREGARQRKGNLWSDWQVRRVMQNPAITGRLPYDRTRRNASGNKVKKRRAEWHTTILGPPIPTLEIIPVARWEAAMAKMGSYNRRETPEPHYTKADQGTLLFTGFARCAHCGGSLVSHHGKTVNRTKHGVHSIPRVMYTCMNKMSRGSAGCSGQRTYAQKKVEGTILPAILRVLERLDQEAVIAEAKTMAEQALFHRQVREDSLHRSLDEVRRIHQGWLQRIDRYFIHPERSLYSEEILAAKVRESEAKVRDLKKEVAALEQAKQSWAEQVHDLERFLSDSHNWWQHFLEAERPRQKALLKHVIDRVVIGRDGYEIHYRVDVGALSGKPGMLPLEWMNAGTWTRIAATK